MNVPMSRSVSLSRAGAVSLPVGSPLRRFAHFQDNPPAPPSGDPPAPPAPPTPGTPPADNPPAGDPPKTEEKPKIFTQDDVDRIVRERLSDEKKRAEKRIEDEKKAAEEARLKEQGEWKLIAEQKDKELADLRAEIAAKEAEIAGKERDALKLKVATEVFKDATQAARIAPRLQGETEAELKADANELAKSFAVDGTTGLGSGGGSHGGGNNGLTPQQKEQAQKELARRF